MNKTLTLKVETKNNKDYEHLEFNGYSANDVIAILERAKLSVIEKLNVGKDSTLEIKKS